MQAVVVALGLIVEGVAWWLVAFRRLSVWTVMSPVLVALGVAAIAAGPVAWSPRLDATVALAGGLLAGMVLYLATRAFVIAVRGWGAFQAQSAGMYLRQGRLSTSAALGLSVVLMVPGEELFWRGLVQPHIATAVDGRTLLAATLTWGGFVLANLPSANLAIVAGAAVGGAVWSALGWWCGGALAPLASHAVWTALMLAFPVVPRAEAAV
jgi:membrane protease YdiL (CAAX protease family)